MSQLTGERREVLECLESVGGEGRVGEIAERLGKSRAVVSYLLSRLLKEGLVDSPRYGRYRIIDTK